MSHDLKSPLNNIISFSSLISKNESFKDEQHKRKLFYIKQSANKMKILIEELLVYHKVEQEDIEFEEVSINEILNATLSNFYLDEKESNLKFVIEELPHIKSNRFLLQILFNNLVSNAIKYQPTCRKNHIPKIEINAKEKLNTIEIYVGDNGIGIESKHLNNLYKPFKRFHTNKAYKGTGLGLSICKRIMDKHNGLIKLHQTSENGTTFKLVFQKVPFVSNFKNTALIDDLATVC